MNLNIICHGNKYIDLVANQQNENQNDKLENIVNTGILLKVLLFSQDRLSYIRYV